MSEEHDAGATATAPRPALPPSGNLAARLSTSPLLLALDIDGTLAPIAPTPDGALVPDETRRTLRALATLPGVEMAFVTGRAVADGQRLVDVPDTWTIGNHGIEWIDPSGDLRVNPSAERYASVVAEAAGRLADPLSRYEGVLLEDKIYTLSIHVRLARPEDIPAIDAELTQVARELGLRVLHGKRIFELRPPVDINKGTALVELATLLGVAEQGSVLYAGDDRTDEDGFRALRSLSPNAVTVHVGPGDRRGEFTSDAEFVVADPSALHELLVWLRSMREADLRRPT